MGKAGPRGFTQARVHGWLAKHGPVTAQQLGVGLNMTTTAANHVLARMLAKGCVKHTPNLRNALWSAVGQRPCDLRGTAPGTLAVLAKTDRHYAVQQMWLAHQKKRGLLPILKCEDRAVMVQKRREGTPGEVPDLPTLASLLLGPP